MKSKRGSSLIAVVACILAILMRPLFFSVMGLLGVEYEGADSSRVYIIYVGLVSSIAFLFYIRSIIVFGFLKSELLVVLSISILFVIHFIWVIFDSPGTELIPQFLMFFLALGLPGFFAAAISIKHGYLEQVVKFSEMFIVVMATGIIVYSAIPSLGGIRVASLGGTSYQALSYYSAFCVGMLILYNFLTPKSFRLNITANVFFRFFSFLLILGCLISVFIGGGRGAFILLLVYLFIFYFTQVNNIKSLRTKNELLYFSLKIIGSVLLFIIFVSLFWENELVQFGFNRATQFFSFEQGLNLEQGSSGRDLVYRDALIFIMNSPIIGFGPFGFREQTIHAHNIVLEIWLQFGIIGVFVFLIAAFRTYLVAKKNWTYVSLWVLFLLLYPLVMTMFSGAYMHSSIFIFAICFYVIYRANSYESLCPSEQCVTEIKDEK